MVPGVNRGDRAASVTDGGPAQRCLLQKRLQWKATSKTKTWREIFLKPKSLPKSSCDSPNSALLRSPEPWECYLLSPSMLDYEKPAVVSSGLVKDIVFSVWLITQICVSRSEQQSAAAPCLPPLPSPHTNK